MSGLGTVCVKGSDDPEVGFSAQGGSGKPVLVSGGRLRPYILELERKTPGAATLES